MDKLISLLLIIHVVAGITCFVSGLVSILTKKGGKPHRLSGKVYFNSMVVVVISAAVIAQYRQNTFLLLISIFAFYFTWAGIRSVRIKPFKPAWIDWVFLVLGLVTSVVMIASWKLILVVFGLLFFVNLIQETILFIRAVTKKPIPRIQYMIRHLSMMLGSYIATTTAFLVTNVQSFQPAWIPWLAPTIIGTPLIVYYAKKYTDKQAVQRVPKTK